MYLYNNINIEIKKALCSLAPLLHPRGHKSQDKFAHYCLHNIICITNSLSLFSFTITGVHEALTKRKGKHILNITVHELIGGT